MFRYFTVRWLYDGIRARIPRRDSGSVSTRKIRPKIPRRARGTVSTYKIMSDVTPANT